MPPKNREQSPEFCRFSLLWVSQLSANGGQMCQSLRAVRVFWLMLMESPETLPSPPPHNSNVFFTPFISTPSLGSTTHWNVTVKKWPLGFVAMSSRLVGPY